MPKTATPRKPETVSRKLAETRNTSKNRSLSSLLGIGDNEKRLAADIGSGLNDVIGRGTIAGLLGLPGDLGGAAENGLRSLLGLPQVVPYGGSEHIGQKMQDYGLVSDVRRPKTELLASLISPTQAFTAGYKAPQMARAGVKALDNLSAPRTMGRQQGAIENLWHASPHEFDKFSLGKAGDGDGASVFGHGAYLSESPEISGHGGHYYKQFMSDAGKANAYEVRLAWPDKAMEARTPLTPENFLKWDRPLSEQGEQVRGLIKENMPSDNDGYIAKLMQDAENDFYENGPGSYPSDRFEAALDEAIKSGNYGERFGADVWDELKEAAPNIDWKGVKARLSTSGAESSTGGGIYDDLVAELGGREAASRRLLEIGIPGIRYPETMSIGNGAHNYVVFDDKLIDIVSRNGQPVGNLGKMVAPQDEALRVAEEAPSIFREGGDRLFGGNADYVARERFNIPALNKISGGGSDRDVYDLGNGYVLKVAKSARGLAQNDASDWYLSNAGILPETVETGQNYIVTQKVLPPNAETKKLVNGLKQFSHQDWRNNSDALQQYLEDNNLSDILNYDVMHGDIAAVRNWGTTADGKPIHLDEGTFNAGILDEFRGKTNMQNPEFRQIHAKSKQAKRKYGDKDKATMYGVGLLAPLLYQNQEP